MKLTLFCCFAHQVHLILAWIIVSSMVNPVSSFTTLISSRRWHCSYGSISSNFFRTFSFATRSYRCSIPVQSTRPTSRGTVCRNEAESSIDSHDHNNDNFDTNITTDSNSATVKFETSSGIKEINVQKGEILRTALLKRGISPHNGRSRLINCRGLGTCGTCAAEIEACNKNETPLSPTTWNQQERLRLNFPPHGGSDQSHNLRLACQVQVNGDISVKKRLGFWGQGSDEQLAQEYESQLWFGDLEYILDSKSPKDINRIQNKSDCDKNNYET
mmetsp:Transcript_2380/g.3167  ORF Transcript_2380/g.3167 Transcript_2380/m.3167 type:complete len:273 (+) Transcript_2380:73-891(+)